MKKWFNLKHNIPWEDQANISDKSNPVYRYADNPSSWDIKCTRVVASCYGKGDAIDIRIIDTDSDKQHQFNITIGEDGKLKARLSEQTK